jgi:hypothetical protein
MATKLPASLKVTKDSLAQLQASIKLLSEQEVLVGFPEETTDDRDDDPGTAPITNAALGYIHDNGQPEQNIPARPFMIPGMEEARESVTRHLSWAAKQVLLRAPGAVQRGLERAGLSAAFAIKRKINEGIPPPLADVTVAERARRGRVGAMWEQAWRAAGAPASLELAKPLVDTGKMRNALTYVIRKRKDRSL